MKGAGCGGRGGAHQQVYIADRARRRPLDVRLVDDARPDGLRRRVVQVLARVLLALVDDVRVDEVRAEVGVDGLAAGHLLRHVRERCASLGLQRCVGDRCRRQEQVEDAHLVPVRRERGIAVSMRRRRLEHLGLALALRGALALALASHR